MLKKTKVKLDLLTNINIRGIRGEIYHAIYWYVEIDNKYMKNNVTNKELSYLKYWDVNNYRVIAWPYLMTLYVIFTINVNFPITSRFVLRATIQKKKKKKKWRIILRYLEKFFFKKTFLWFYTCMLFLINFSVLPQSLPIFYIPLSIIYQSFSPYNILYTQFFLNFPRRFSF